MKKAEQIVIALSPKEENHTSAERTLLKKEIKCLGKEIPRTENYKEAVLWDAPIYLGAEKGKNSLRALLKTYKIEEIKRLAVNICAHGDPNFVNSGVASKNAQNLAKEINEYFQNNFGKNISNIRVQFYIRSCNSAYPASLEIDEKNLSAIYAKHSYAGLFALILKTIQIEDSSQHQYSFHVSGFVGYFLPDHTPYTSTDEKVVSKQDKKELIGVCLASDSRLELIGKKENPTVEVRVPNKKDFYCNVVLTDQVRETFKERETSIGISPEEQAELVELLETHEISPSSELQDLTEEEGEQVTEFKERFTSSLNTTGERATAQQQLVIPISLMILYLVTQKLRVKEGVSDEVVFGGGGAAAAMPLQAEEAQSTTSAMPVNTSESGGEDFLQFLQAFVNNTSESRVRS